MLLSLVPVPYRWLMLAVLIVACVGFGYIKGDAHGTQKLTDHIAKEATEAARIAVVRQTIVGEVQTKYVDRIQKIKVPVVKEVRVYVKSDCPIPVGFVRVWNSAWTGTPPGPPAESDAGPTGVSLAAVAEAESANAQTCRIYKEQRDGVIEFYRKQQGVR